MLSTTSPDDSPTLNNITPTMSIDTSDIYELHLGDDRSRSASTSSSMNGTTILSSLAPSSLTQSSHDETRANSGRMVHVQMASSLTLSLNPSMVDSSVLIPSETNANGNWIGLHLHDRATLSESSISSSEISTCTSSCSTPCYAPEYLFANIGRSLMHASASSDANNGSDDGCDALSKSSRVTESANAKGSQWWDRLQTDEDWDNFRTSANDYLNALVVEELTKRNECSSGNGCSMDKTSLPKEITQKNSEGFSRVRQWLQGLYEALTASTIGIISEDTFRNTKYLSSLVEEIADIQQQLERLPPMPPTLPEELSLGDLPSESRDLLIQYRDRLDAWRGEAMPQREELSARYVQCQEKLLAAIIDAEEVQFWGKKCADKLSNEGNDSMRDQGTVGVCYNKDGCNTLGAVNDDGYIEVIEQKSPLWDDVNGTLITSQSKCQLTLRAAFVAALTAGAGFFLTLQSKRR